MPRRAALPTTASTTHQEIPSMTAKPTMSPAARPAGRSARRIARLAVVFGVVMGAWMALVAGSASAKEVHAYESTFNGSDSPGGAFSFAPWALAVDNSGGPSAGDVYVGETNYFANTSRVVKVGPDGAYAGVEFAGADTPAGSFSFLGAELKKSGVAVDGSAGPNAGDVYVADAAHGVVDRFSESGTFICQISGKTPTTPAEEEAECAGAAGSQTPAGGLGIAGGIAVNPLNGDIFVGDTEESALVNEFNAAGEYIGQIVDPHVIVPGVLAFDSAGHLYVDNVTAFVPGSVVKFGTSGAYESTVEAEGTLAMTVDPADDDVFVYRTAGPEAESIGEYDASGALLDSFGHKYEFTSLAVNGSSGQVYVVSGSFAGSTVDVYSGLVAVPDVAAKPATAIEEESATLNGEIDPAGGGDVESCQFEWGTTAEYGETVPCSEALPYASTTAVSAAIAGLAPSTTYHFRVAAANANGVESYSEDETFATKGAPTVESESTDGIDHFGATVHASINPHGYPTDFVVEYVDQAHFEGEGFTNAESTAPAPVGSQLTVQEVTARLSGLKVGTEYHYKVVATSSKGDGEGSEMTFETLPIVERVDMYPLAETKSALLRERVNPLGLDTICQVQYASDAQFQASGWAGATTLSCTPGDLGAGSQMIYVRTRIHGLQLAGTYHTRFVISNASGVVATPDRVITTFGLKRFSMKALNEEGEPVTQAGAHPYELDTEFEVPTNAWETGGSVHNGATATLKDIRTELPVGLIGNPNGIPQCPQRLEEVRDCPPDTQVGLISIRLVNESGEKGWTPVFNLVPPKGVAAKFGAWINIGISAYIQSDVRTGKDYGINADSIEITSFANAGLIKLKMWGNPGDEGHTTAEERYCAVGHELGYEHPCSPAGLSSRPFLSMPTQCTGAPLVVNGSIDSYQEPSERIAIRDEMPAITGCNAIEFNPSLEARPTTNVADSPSGLHVDLHVPQNEDEAGLRVADLRDAKVTLPPGLVVNPSGANGLTGCSSAAFDEHGPGPARCPDAAKIGTVEVDTPLIGHPLPGAVYIATPYDNPFHSLLAIYAAVYDPISGVVIKLAGHVEADPRTGRLTTTFDENPQLPFDDFKFDFFKGAKAPLRTPAVCGQYETTSVLTPWSAPQSGPSPTPADHYGITQEPGGGSCPTSSGSLPNAPSFDAGTVSPSAGKYTPMVLHLRREDGSQEFDKLTVTPPAGLLAKLAGTPYCSDSAIAAAGGRSGTEEAASPSCPSGSEVGTVHVGAGAGPAPYYVNGHVYLAGPYKGAPLSLAIVTPATAGPYDLGTVVVRVALQVNPETTQITAVSDPIPHILQGIPLDIRSIGLELGKPEFTRNGTSCDATTLGGQLRTILGQSISLSNHFQLGDCTNLGFKPKLSTRLFGPVNRGAHPKLRAIVSMPAGDADIASAAVTLPHSVFLDQGHIGTVCTRVQYGQRACPAKSVYGWARAWSPLLAQPLEGPVYLRSNGGERKLPDLVAALDGQIHVDLVGWIDSVKGRMRTRFMSVPDAPVSKFMLTMRGGHKGLLQNSTNVCRGHHRAVASFDAHSGATSDSRPALVDGKCRRHRKHKKVHRKHKRGHGAQKGHHGHKGRKR
jgi:hypothetical protein